MKVMHKWDDSAIERSHAAQNKKQMTRKLLSFQLSLNKQGLHKRMQIFDIKEASRQLWAATYLKSAGR